jgi:hypothetical protein
MSCMDLTVGVSTALLSSGLLPLKQEHNHIPRRSSTLKEYAKKSFPNENIYEELKTPLSTFNKGDAQQFLFNSNKTRTMKTTNDVNIRTPSMKTKANHVLINAKSAMKKGISEPNLAKVSRTKSTASTFFSPRGLLDRFKRILPLSLSKQSINQQDNNGMTIDSDDSASTSSENNDDIRTSKLDHVSRVKNVYDTLGMYNKFDVLYFLIGAKYDRIDSVVVDRKGMAVLVRTKSSLCSLSCLYSVVSFISIEMLLFLI